MATISLLSRLVNGVQRQVDLSANTLWVQDLQLNNSSGWTLAGTTSGHAGSSLIGDDNSYTNFTPASATIKGALSGIDAKLGATGSGTVTSVALSAPVSVFSVSGSPVTTSGTLAITFQTQSANMVFAGPATGSAATPTFRSLVAADIPDLSAVYANLALSNLSSVAINTSLLPGTDDSINLGSVSKSWASANIHTLADGSGVTSVDAYGRLLEDASGVTSVDYANRVLKDSSAATQLTWSTSGVEINANPLNLNSNAIINVADPSNPQDAATKHYVDQLVSGISWKEPVQAIASSANVPLTGSTPLVIDSYTVLNGDSVILADQTVPTQNGVYTVSISGGSYTTALRTDSATPVVGFAYLVENGTNYTNSAWQINAISPNTTFVQFAGPQELVFNSPLSRSGNDVSLNYGNGLTTSGSNLVVEAADTSITVASGGISVNIASGTALTTSSGLQVVVSSTGGVQISAGALALKLVGSTGALATSASGLTVQYDSSTVGVNGSNQLYIPNAGVTKTQINTNVFDQTTITGGAGTSASVVSSPSVQFAGVAGQTFSANTTYAVRYGLTSNSETAGRLYAADITTSSFDLFWVVGFVSIGGSSVSSGGAVTVIKFGQITLGTSDTNFGSTDPGKPCFLQSGGVNATTTAPSTSGQAVAKIGMVLSTTSFLADICAPYVY